MAEPGPTQPSPAQPRAAPAALRGRCWRRSAAGAMRRRRAAALLELSAGERGGMGMGTEMGWARLPPQHPEVRRGEG